MEESNEENISGNLTDQNNMDLCIKGPGHRAVITSLYLVPLVLGQPMSARLLWITLSSKHLDVLNCNLALFHLLQYCFFYAQVAIIFIIPHLQVPFYWFIFVYIQVGGPMQLCLICLERFIAVIYPTYFPLLKKHRCREICATVVWMLSLTIPTLFMFKEKLESMDDMAQYFSVCLMATLSFIMVFTSIKVAKVLRNPVGKDSVHPMKKRAFITISVTSAAAMSCYIPVMVMGQLYVNDEDKYRCKLIPVCIFFLSTASLVHPLFYLYAKGQFSCRRCHKQISFMSQIELQT